MIWNKIFYFGNFLSFFKVTKDDYLQRLTEMTDQSAIFISI